LNEFRFKNGCDLTRGTRGKAHPQSAFKVFLPNVASPPLPPEASLFALLFFPTALTHWGNKVVLKPDYASVPEAISDHHYVRSTVLQSITLRSFDKNRSLLIEAQAGQGKTTLARQYLTHISTRGLWYPLSPEDNDVVVLIDRLYALLKNSVKHFSSRLLTTMLAKGEISYQNMGRYARILLADLKKAIKEDLFIVFDDLHLIETSPASLKFLEAFLSTPNHGLYFILISRRRIPRQIRALFQSGQCVYLDSQALAFSKKETRNFVLRCMEMPLSRTQLNRLYETTNGWVMGLRFKCLSMRINHPKPGECLDGDAELDFHYFAEEVYPFMASYVSATMLKLALLDEIPLALAHQTGDGQGLCDNLDYLHRNNFFLSQWGDKGDAYAFHHLFRDFLRVKCREQCRAEEIDDFLNMAGRWYEQAQEFEKALSCYLKAKNHDAIEALLEQHGLSIYRKGHLYCVYRLLRQIPGPVTESRSWTSFFLGLIAIELAPASALRCLHISRDLFASQKNRPGELLATTEICFSHIFIDGNLKVGKALFARATELFSQLRHSLPPFYLVRTANALGTCHFYFFGDTNASHACITLAKETARDHDMRTPLVEAYTASCFNRMGQGKFFKSAEEIDAQLIHLSDPMVKNSAKLLARIAHLNQLEITGDFFNYTYLKPILHRQTGDDLAQSTVLQGFTTIWETYQALANGDTDQALQLTDAALARDGAGQSAHITSQFHHLQAFTYGIKKKREKALAAASTSIALRHKAHVPYFVTLQAMIIGAMYVQLDMEEEAETFLTRAIEGSKGLGERFIRCGALAHRAFLNLNRNQTQAALADTGQLLSLMEKERYVHFDTWLPQVMLPVLQFAHAQGVSPEFARSLAARRLNVSFNADNRALPLLDITTLGQFTLRLEGQVILDGTRLSHNEQRLLAAVICSPSLSIGIHDMCHMLWPESDEKKAMRSLKVTLFRLRKKVSHPAFDFQDYLQHKNRQLFLAHCRIDAHDFLDATARGTAQCRNHQHWQAANAFRYALSLWKGPFLKSIAYDDTAGEFNDSFFLNALSNAATSWSALINLHGAPIPEDLELIERSVPRGAGTTEMLKNLFDIHTASGNTGKIHLLTQAYREALVRIGYTDEEVEEELERLWVHETHASMI